MVNAFSFLSIKIEIFIKSNKKMVIVKVVDKMPFKIFNLPGTFLTTIHQSSTLKLNNNILQLYWLNGTEKSKKFKAGWIPDKNL